VNFKPADRQASPNSIQKLQDLDGPLEGTLVEVSQSKMGSRVYHIRRDYDLVRIFGFKDLDKQMGSIRPESLVRITYQGSEPTYSGKVRHLAKVEVADDAVETSTMEPQSAAREPDREATVESQRMPTPISIDDPTEFDSYNRFLQKLGITK